MNSLAARRRKPVGVATPTSIYTDIRECKKHQPQTVIVSQVSRGHWFRLSSPVETGPMDF
jgi:hypothetical protein